MNYPENLEYLFDGLTTHPGALTQETYLLNILNTDGLDSPVISGGDLFFVKPDGAYISRWPENKFPLNIYLEPQEGHHFSSFELKELMWIVQRAMAEVQEIDPEVFQFALVTQSHLADIVIRYHRTGLHEGSHCYPDIADTKQIIKANIAINVPRDFSPEWILADVVHNLLHALGAFGHSNDPQDMGHIDYVYRTHLISERDKMTLKLLYRCPIAMTQGDLKLLWSAHRQKTLSAVAAGQPKKSLSTLDNPTLQWRGPSMVFKS